MLHELNIKQDRISSCRIFRVKISCFRLSFASNPIDPCNLFLVARGKRGVCPSTSDITGPYIKSLSVPVSPSFIRRGETERERETVRKEMEKGGRRLWKDRKERERGCARENDGRGKRGTRENMRYERKRWWQGERKGRNKSREREKGAFFIVFWTFLWKNQGTIFYPRDVRVTPRVDDEP